MVDDGENDELSESSSDSIEGSDIKIEDKEQFMKAILIGKLDPNLVMTSEGDNDWQRQGGS